MDQPKTEKRQTSTSVPFFSEPIVRFRTVGVALTMRCNFECTHCITESSPRLHSALSDGEAEQLVEAVHGQSSHICFTGGETTLKLEMLVRSVRHARSLGLIPTIVTNGHWARNEALTAAMLGKLKVAGLGGICVSLDRFHLQFVGPENALRIAKMSADYGLLHVVRMCYTKGEKFAHEFIEQYKDAGVKVQAVPVLRLGRARTLPLDAFESNAEPPDHSCGTVISPLAMPDGLVQACCGPGIEFTASNPLNLGNWREEPLAEILRRGRANPFVIMMNNRGPMELARQLQARGFDPLKSGKRAAYSSICDLCIDLLNCPETVAAANVAFADPHLKTQMIAGQAYKQALDLLKRRKEDNEPQFSG